MTSEIVWLNSLRLTVSSLMAVCSLSAVKDFLSCQFPTLDDRGGGGGAGGDWGLFSLEINAGC